MSFNYPAFLEGTKRVFKRADTYFLTVSLVWFVVAVIFHSAYGYLSTTLVVTGIITLLFVTAAIIWSLRHPSDDTLFEYAVPATISAVLAVYVGAALTFYVFPLLMASMAIALAARGRQP
jgi:hypothetical protein